MDFRTGTSIYRIAIFLRLNGDHVKQILGKEYMDCSFDYYDLNSLEELRETLLQVKNRYHGILTSGTFSDRFVSLYTEGDTIPHQYFAPSLENYYRQMLLHTMHNPELKLEQIRLDLMTKEYDLPNILERNQLGMLMSDERVMINNMTAPQVELYEQEMIARHERAIKLGGYRLFMTRSSLAAQLFEREHIPYSYVKLLPDDIFRTVEALRQEIEMQKLRDSRVASIYVLVNEQTSESQREKIAPLVEQYAKTRGIGTFPLTEINQNFEAMTDAQAINIITRERTFSELSSLLYAEGIDAAVGYGIGETGTDARDHAMTAARYAGNRSIEDGKSFLIDSDGKITALTIGLKSSQQEEIQNPKENFQISTSTVNEVAKQSHISSSTLFRLMTAMQQSRRQEVDSAWIARELEVSPRMANKILANLKKAGYAQVTGQSQWSGKGRPNNIYRLNF